MKITLQAQGRGGKNNPGKNVWRLGGSGNNNRIAFPSDDDLASLVEKTFGIPAEIGKARSCQHRTLLVTGVLPQKGRKEFLQEIEQLAIESSGSGSLI